MKLLYKALADFQQEVPNIYKNSQGYGYKFADLGEINEIIKPLLKKHGLGYIQPLDGTTVKTVIFHVKSGESVEGSADIPQGVQLKGMNDFQVMGSAITYLRRYSLSSMLGLVTDEDADAAGEQLKKERKANTNNDTSGGDQEILARAKADINTRLVEQNYTTADSKKAFIKLTLGKETIDSIDDAHEVADALDNER